MSERKAGVRCHSADGGVWSEDLEELRVKNLEKWRGRVCRIEKLGD